MEIDSAKDLPEVHRNDLKNTKGEVLKSDWQNIQSNQMSCSICTAIENANLRDMEGKFGMERVPIVPFYLKTELFELSEIEICLNDHDKTENLYF
ncbi:hypothetical protein NPIL_506911 [Nephila pilipes]|uniref:Uncharacterized protein n=1 Tax=Nephila pilipes TaxID=299642 RepID=A0A8X6M8G8_NEPPI|nr:hypothetical protein NPIL_506911 [Nephila pilipes]